MNNDDMPDRRPRLELDADNVAGGLAQLVLTLIKLIRELMERQAIARLEGGDLTADQAEQLGATLQALDANMDVLVEQFGITRDDLNLDLGPLGKLM